MKDSSFFGFLLGCLFMMLLGPMNQYMKSPAEESKAISPVRAYNPHWQDMQNAKFSFCHQKMPTEATVNKCLFTLGVFI